MLDLRNDFPILRGTDVVYLDSAATAQRPACVIEAERAFNDTHNANPLRGLYAWSMEATDAYEHARQTVADFVGAKQAEEIVFTRNTTEGLNLIAYTWAMANLKLGDEVLVTVMEHHSNLLPWQLACERTGATLRFLECTRDGIFPEEAMRAAVNEHTRLVCMGHVSNVYGRVNPVERMAELAHSVGALMVCDAAQSAPHIPLDVQKLGVDFLVFSGHKLCGPMGIGALWARLELLEAMPPFLRGGEMIEYVTREHATWAEVPHKFEAGTVNAAGAVGLEAAIHYLQAAGLDAVEAHVNALTDRALKAMRAMPHIHVIGSDRAEEHSGILTFTVDDVHPHDIAAILDSDKVCIRAGHHCAQPLMKHLGVGSTARASIYLYNNTEDVDRFLDSLSSLRSRMGYGE